MGALRKPNAEPENKALADFPGEAIHSKKNANRTAALPKTTSKKSAATNKPVLVPRDDMGEESPEEFEKSTISMIRDINAKLASVAATKAQVEAEVIPEAKAGPNIWDLDDDGSDAEAIGQAAAAPEPARASARQRRTKTRLMGFDKSDGTSVDALAARPSSDEDIEAAPRVTFPVGWILVVKGPGRGESFPLINGLSSIGRAADQTVRLNFGDAAISRSGHAALVYDSTKKTYTLGHGNKANIVRLNDKPVITNETVKDGDHIRIGDTTLRVVALCNGTFDWSDYKDQEGDEDVAIA